VIFLITLIVVAALCLLCRNGIKRYPAVLYAVALVLDVLLFLSAMDVLPKSTAFPTVILMRRGGLGVALFVVVMYIGVLPREGKASKWLRPIRAELSIAACLLVAGHMCVYLAQYSAGILAGSIAQGHMIPAFVMAVLLLALMLVLGGTSLRTVKRRMKAATWKKLQNFSYLFYALVYLHLMFMIGASALQGMQPALTNAIAYTLVFAVYAVLRLWRAYVDKKEKVDLASTVMEQGFKA